MLITKFSQFVIRAWYNKNPLLIILRPLAWLWSWLSNRRRQKLSTQAWLAPVPTIIIGNISVGGTGKTPLVIYLAGLLARYGFQPLIISRGYKGQYHGSKLVIDTDEPSEVGDEALLIKQQTNMPVIISHNRVRAAQQGLAEVPPIPSKRYADARILLSDDGLQHYRLGRHIEIAVVDGERKFGNQQILPEGPLREKLNRLAEVDFIIVNGEKAPITQDKDLSIYANKLYPMQLKPNEFYPAYLQSLESCLSVKHFKEKFGIQIKAVAAIGNPSRFLTCLEHLGFKSDVYIFPDHYLFTEDEIIKILYDKNPEHPIVMTSKDAVKCQNFPFKKLWYLDIKVQLPESFNQAFIQKIMQIIATNTKQA